MRDVSTTFAAAIGLSHDLATEVTVLRDGDELLTIASAIDGGVTLDATAATRGRLDLTIVDDGTLGLVPLLASDPLAPYGNELHVKRGIILAGTPELVGLGVFRIDDLTVDDTPAGLQLRVAGQDRSARIIDARFEDPYQVAAATNYTTAISDVLLAAWPSMPYSFTATTSTTPALVAAEGDDRWKFAQDMAASIGMTLYFDGDGTCILRPVTSVSNTPVATFAEGVDGVLLTVSRKWTRQGAFNRVIATGENTGQGTPSRGVATDDNPLSPTYYFGPFGKVPRFYVSPFITTDAQASSAAAAILSRELGTTQQLSLGAIVNPALEPDDVITVTREISGVGENNTLDSITIPLSAEGQMSASTRATVSTG